MALTLQDVIDNIAKVLNGADGEYVAQIYNQICSDKVTYKGDSLFERNDPLAGNPKLEVLENLGYDIDGDSDQPGMWIWTAPTNGCEISYASAEEALDAAWADAVGQTMGILNMSSEQWDALSFSQQKELVSDTLTGD